MGTFSEYPIILHASLTAQYSTSDAIHCLRADNHMFTKVYKMFFNIPSKHVFCYVRAIIKWICSGPCWPQKQIGVNITCVSVMCGFDEAPQILNTAHKLLLLIIGQE